MRSFHWTGLLMEPNVESVRERSLTGWRIRRHFIEKSFGFALTAYRTWIWKYKRKPQKFSVHGPLASFAIPAQAGIQRFSADPWIPACAGMTDMLPVRQALDDDYLASETQTNSLSLRAKQHLLANAGADQTTSRPKHSPVGSSTWNRLISS